MSSFHGGLPGEGGAVEEGLFSLGPGALTGSVFTGDTLLVIRAPSGTRLEVPVPEVSDKGLHGLCVCVCVCVHARMFCLWKIDLLFENSF